MDSLGFITLLLPPLCMFEISHNKKVKKNVTQILCQYQFRKTPTSTTSLSQDGFIYSSFSVFSRFSIPDRLFIPFTKELGFSVKVWRLECLNKMAWPISNRQPPWPHSVGHPGAEGAGCCLLYLLLVGAQGPCSRLCHV